MTKEKTNKNAFPFFLCPKIRQQCVVHVTPTTTFFLFSL